MLTPRQADTLTFISGFIERHRYAPSFDQIAAGIGVKSKSNVLRLVTALEDRGIIRRMPGKSRSIRVVPETEREFEVWWRRAQKEKDVNKPPGRDAQKEQARRGWQRIELTLIDGGEGPLWIASSPDLWGLNVSAHSLAELEQKLPAVVRDFKDAILERGQYAPGSTESEPNAN